MRTPRHLARAIAVAAALATIPPVAAAYPTSPPAAQQQTQQQARQQAPLPRAVSLVGTHLRLAGGRAVRLPRAAGAAPVLLGTVPQGWVVASGSTFRLVRPNGTVRTIKGRDQINLYVSESLSDDGRRIVSAALDQGDTFTIRVVDLRGKVVYRDWFEGLLVEVMDADDGLVYVGGQRGLFVLDEATASKTRVLRRPTALVDLEHDVVFVGTRKRPWRTGPTSLAAPGTPRWRSTATPVAVSPGGSYVLSDDGTVRALDDGRLVRRVPTAGPRDGGAFEFLGWASDRRVLVETTAGKRRLLTSCPVPRGTCRVVGSTRGRVSLPTSHAGPFLQP
ncbi:hypothetical protein [Nocardioides marmotae]|uniref:hypothetical protein n=1 Tax=Nocardioides marmotae TaxID=2663857 RepID=UPI0012B56E8F|nr:hypothetical protein [Nocardioides marmotae]MBC9735580.1 hypothetical protein [Nocardioides marmotae]MTB86676.1 hypothetical protein [Nocardioides marmotae]